MVDLGAKYSRFMLLLVKFFDLGVGCFWESFLKRLKFFGLLGRFFFKGYDMNVVVVVLFFVFLFL